MAAEQSPAFQFYPKDFLTDSNVVAMTLPERGAYITLLCICWLERSLSTDPTTLARLCRVTPARFTQLWPALEPCFAVVDGRLIQPRMERERQKQETYRALKAAAGRKGGRPKVPKKQTESRSKTNESPPSSSSSSSSFSSPISDVALFERAELAVKSNGELLTQIQDTVESIQSRTQEFIAWFQVEYKARRHGADYLVNWKKDAPTVKRMLHAVTFPQLQDDARIMLSDKCDDRFIVESDRGIGMLSTKFNWLNGRRVDWELRQAGGTA